MPGAFDITARDQRFTTSFAVTRKLTRHEAEALFSFALRGAHIASDFPLEHLRCAAEGGVHAPPGCRRAVLGVCGRGGEMESGDRNGALADVAVAEPALQTPAQSTRFGCGGDGEASGRAVGFGRRTDETRAVLLVVDARPQGNDGTADHGLQACGNAPIVGEQSGVCRSPALVNEIPTVAVLGLAGDKKADAAQIDGGRAPGALAVKIARLK